MLDRSMSNVDSRMCLVGDTTLATGVVVESTSMIVADPADVEGFDSSTSDDATEDLIMEGGVFEALC